MDVKERNLAFRVAFVFFCLLPTAVHVWSIFSTPKTDDTKTSSGNRQLTHSDTQPNPEKRLTDKESESSTVSPVEHEGYSWTKGQGIDVSQVPLGGHCNLLRSQLPAGHPLEQFPCKAFEIVETESEVRLVVPEMVISNSTLRGLQQRFRSGGFDSIYPENRDMRLRIERLAIKKLESIPSRTVDLLGVELFFPAKAQSVVVTGRRSVSIANVSNDSKSDGSASSFTEFPFRISVDGTIIQSKLVFSGQAFPAWLLNSQFASQLGDAAELNGRLEAAVQSVDGSIQRLNNIQFAGWLNGVANEKLTAWLNPAGHPLASGTCQIQCDEFSIRNSRIDSFRGIVRSSSNGTVVSDLAVNLGPQVTWAARETKSEYQSFLLDVTFRQQKLDVKSKYEGGLLVWYADGSAILVAR